MFLHCAIAMQVWITLMLLYFVHVQVNAFVTVPCSWNNFNIPAMSSACFFDEITFGSFKSIGYKSLIGIVTQITRLYCPPNLYNCAPYECTVLKFPPREQSALQM